MPRRTNSDAIRDLETMTAALSERLDGALDKITRLSAGLDQTNDVLTQSRVEQAVLQERLEHLRQTVEHMQQTRWKVYLLVLGAALSFLANLIILGIQRRM